MKKILLSVAIIATSFAFGQTLQIENFNNLTIGNVGTDFNGDIPGQSNWLTASSNGDAPTTSTNAAASNFKIIAAGNNSSQGLQITGPNGDKGFRYMWKDGLDAAWTSRTVGNNIIEVEYDLFTGPITGSRTQIGMRIFGVQDVAGVPTTRTLNGFVYTTNTRVLTGIAFIQNGAASNTYLINFATGGLVLNANTWYTIGCSYNTVTGEVLWKTDSASPANGLADANYIPGMLPLEVDFLQSVIPAAPAAGTTPAVPANIFTSNISFDNYVARAVSVSNLLGTSDFTTSDNAISVYPNPAKDILNLKVGDASAITAVQIVDLNGREVFTKTFDNVTDAQIDVNELSTGMYLINITSGEKSVTKKFLKQ